MTCEKKTDPFYETVTRYTTERRGSDTSSNLTAGLFPQDFFTTSYGGLRYNPGFL